MFEVPEYAYEEFEAISLGILKKLPQNTVIQIASSVWKSGSRDIRDVLKNAKLCVLIGSGIMLIYLNSLITHYTLN